MALDDLPVDLPHGTTGGYAAGCTVPSQCPHTGTDQLSCSEAFGLSVSDYSYRRAIKIGATPGTSRRWLDDSPGQLQAAIERRAGGLAATVPLPQRRPVPAPTIADVAPAAPPPPAPGDYSPADVRAWALEVGFEPQPSARGPIRADVLAAWVAAGSPVPASPEPARSTDTPPDSLPESPTVPTPDPYAAPTPAPADDARALRDELMLAEQALRESNRSFRLATEAHAETTDKLKRAEARIVELERAAAATTTQLQADVVGEALEPAQRPAIPATYEPLPAHFEPMSALLPLGPGRGRASFQLPSPTGLLALDITVTAAAPDGSRRAHITMQAAE